MSEQTMTIEEQLAVLDQDMNGVAQAIASHEKTIFHVIVATNAIQALLVKRNLVTNEELQAEMQAEAKKLSDFYMQHLEANANKQPDEAQNDAGLILP